MTNWKSLLSLLGFLCLFFFASINSSLAQNCPTSVQAFPTSGVPNFPALDELVPCGDADTLSMIIFTAPNVESYPEGITLTIDLNNGLRYAGFFDDIFAITIEEVDVSDPTRPVFLLDNVSSGVSLAFYIGVEASCSLPSSPEINLDINYEAQVGGVLLSCQDLFRPLLVHDDINPPNITITDATPIPLSFQDFSTESCDTITIDQSQRNSYTDTLHILIEDIDLINTLALSSAQVNGMSFDLSNANFYSYDAIAMQANLSISGSFFTGNTVSSSSPSAMDERFDEGEEVTVELCFTARDCAVTNEEMLTIGATFGCYDELCNTFRRSQVEIPLDFEPISRVEPEVTAINVQNGSLCGDPFIVDLMLESNMASAEGAFLDVRSLFDLCAADHIMLTDVSLLTSTGSYISLPFGETEVVEFDTLNADGTLRVDIHLDRLNSDPDGDNFGLSDIDDDGDFGDLAGDQQLMLRLSYQVLCSDLETRMNAELCSPLACMVENIIVTGTRNCEQEFQQMTTIEPPISYFYGADSVYTNEIAGAIDIGTGNIASDESVQEIVELIHGYRFREENITQCSNPMTYAEIVIKGAADFVDDLEFVAGSASFSGMPISDADVSLSLPSGDGTRMLRIDIGNIPNVEGQFEELRYQVQFNECRCSPRLTTFYSRIIEDCPDCDGCSIVKSCEAIQLEKAGNECTNCDCLMASVDTLMRQTTGFTDKTMTTPLTMDEVAVSDQKRFLPGDFMFTKTRFQFRSDNQHTMDAFANPSYWDFYVRNEPITQFGNADVDVCSTDWRVKTSLWSTNESILSGFYLIRGGLDSGNAPEALSFSNSSCIQLLDFPTQIDASTGIDINAVTIQLQGGQDFEEGNRITIRLEGACLTAFLAENNLSATENFDIVLEHSWRVIPNPGYDPSLTPVTAVVNGGFGAGYNDGSNEFQDWYCDAGEAYEFHLPGPVISLTEVTAKDCRVEVSHNFTLENNVPLDWYSSEYRPIMGLAFADILYPDDLIFTGDISVYDYAANFQNTLPNVMHAGASMSFEGENYYVASNQFRIEDSEFLNATDYACGGVDNRTQILNPVSDNTLVGSDMPLLGVGFDSENCQFSLHYELLRVCQDNIDLEGFQVIAGGSMATTFCYANSPWRADGTSNMTNDYLANDLDKTTFGADMEQMANADLLYYWPYAPTSFGTVENFPYPLAYTDAGGTPTTATDPGFANIYGLQRNPFNSLDTTMTIRFMDMASTFPSLTSTIEENELLENREGNEQNIYKLCLGSDGSTLDQFYTIIEVPASIDLVSITPVDASGNPLAAPIDLDIISSDANSTIYIFEPELSLGSCNYYQLTTELIFCSIGSNFSTEINITSELACLARPLAEAININPTCLSTIETYDYIREESDLMVGFLTTEDNQYQLCDEFCVVMQLENIRPTRLFDINPNYFFSPGLDFVSGSWEIAYPGVAEEELDMNTCMDNLVWQSIPDPTQRSPEFPRGTSYGHDLDDLLGAAGGLLDDVIMNGLPGSDFSNTNKNKIALRFRINTLCNGITLESIRFRTNADNICEERLSSNLSRYEVNIENTNSNPDLYDPLLLITDFLQLACGETGQAIISTINTENSAINLDGIRQCFNIPSGIIDYVEGSLQYVEPVAFDLMLTETEIASSDTLNAFTQLCFNTPPSLEGTDFYQISFDYQLQDTATCSNNLDVTIGSELQTEICAASGQQCAIASMPIDARILIDDLPPPLSASNLEVSSSCNGQAGSLEYAYSFDLFNTTNASIEGIEIEIFPDSNGNGLLDEEERDIPLNTISIGGVNLGSGANTTINGMTTLPISCPLFFSISQSGPCGCMEAILYTDSIRPTVFEDLGTSIELCTGGAHPLNLCNDYSPALGNDFMFSNGNGTVEVLFGMDTQLLINSNPIGAVDFNLSGNTLTATLNTGFGDTVPTQIDITAFQGSCAEQHSIEVLLVENSAKCLPAAFEIQIKGGE